MPWKSISPIEIYKLLPRTNCQKCGEENCMAFAAKLVNMETKLDKCTPLLEEPKYKANYEKIWSIIKPAVKEVIIKRGDISLKIGGEYVMYRHDLTYINPPPIALDVDDEMSENEIINRVKFTENFSYTYTGINLKLDMIAIRSVSEDPKKFMKTVKIVMENTKLPIMLCSFKPEIIEAGLSLLKNDRPLIYAATESNWNEMTKLAKEYKCPLTVFSPGDMDGLLTITKNLLNNGINDLIIDPGTFVGNGLSTTINSLVAIRWKACEEGDSLYGFPTMGVPITAWFLMNGDKLKKATWEAIAAASLIVNHVSLLVMHSIEGWVLLPITILKYNIYTDPRKPVSVKPELKIIGNPNEWSPVFVTSNFVLTYYLVSGDIENSKIDSYLLIVDTEGYAVDVATAANKFIPDKFKEVIDGSGLEKKVKHRILVIPRKAAKISGEVEDAIKWRVIVGPSDSSEIPVFIKNEWPKILEEWKSENK
ncbi:MAG: acetyl-CoA decarbonylase/synthase complex subunit gamma [Nitrososphaerota archaeon]